MTVQFIDNTTEPQHVIKSDNPDPENIEWKHAEPFNPEQYLSELGRGDKTARVKVSMNEMNALLRRPSSMTLATILGKWAYEPGTTKGYPHDPRVEFRSAINEIDPRPYDKVLRNGDSYFSAVAMVVYGDANFWYLTRAEHFQYYIGVLADPSHPRYDVYKRLNNSGKPGSHPTSYLRLSDRIKTPNCWVHHEFIQQVTADLYGLFLVIFSSPPGSEEITNVQARGIFNAPHRLLRYKGGNTYWPLVPASHPTTLSEYRFPMITFENTKGEVGVVHDLKKEESDALHPWRRPFSDTPVPEGVSPVPIRVLGPLRREVVEMVLWLTVEG